MVQQAHHCPPFEVVQHDHDLDDAPARGLVRYDLIEEYSAALCGPPRLVDHPDTRPTSVAH